MQPMTCGERNVIKPKNSLVPLNTQQSGSEIWAESLFLAEGDISNAIFILADRLAACDLPPSAVAAAVDYVGLSVLTEHGILETITSSLETEGQPKSRLLALQTITSLIKVCEKSVEPLLLSLLPAVLACVIDKDSAISKAAFETAALYVAAEVTPYPGDPAALDETVEV